MPHLMRSTALIALMTASPAIADVTPQDVLAMWQMQAEAFGLGLDTEQQYDGDTLILDSYRINMTLPEDAGWAYAEFNGATLTQAEDGTVLVTFPDDMNVTIETSGNVLVQLDGTTQNYQGIVSGDPDDMTTNWSADTFSLSLGKLVTDDITFNDISGSFAFTGAMEIENHARFDDTHLHLTQSSTFPGYKMAYNFNGFDGDDTKIDGGGLAGRGSSTTSMSVPRSGIDVFNLHSQLREGLSLTLTTNTGSNSSFQTIKEGESIITDQRTIIHSQTAEISFSDAGFTFNGETGKINFQMHGQALPLPVTVDMTSLGMRYDIPLLKTGTPQSASVFFDFSELTIGNFMWDMFDPEAKLPREPMNVRFDIRSTVTLLADLLDFKLMEKFVGKEVPPVTLHATDIYELLIAGAGAELLANGAFTFNNDDLETYDGFPAPAGELTARIEGAHGLIDTLIDMELLDSNEALGARAALNLMTVADDDGVLHSQIEVKADGQIIANGQRIK